MCDKLCHESFESDKYHSDPNDTLKMNLGTELQCTVAYFIGFILESICYGMHRPDVQCQHLVQTLTFMHRLI